MVSYSTFSLGPNEAVSIENEIRHMYPGLKPSEISQLMSFFDERFGTTVRECEEKVDSLQEELRYTFDVEKYNDDLSKAYDELRDAAEAFCNMFSGGFVEIMSDESREALKDLRELL